MQASPKEIRGFSGPLETGAVGQSALASVGEASFMLEVRPIPAIGPGSEILRSRSTNRWTPPQKYLQNFSGRMENGEQALKDPARRRRVARVWKSP
jgi:hypothetical protein